MTATIAVIQFRQKLRYALQLKTKLQASVFGGVTSDEIIRLSQSLTVISVPFLILLLLLRRLLADFRRRITSKST